MKSACTVHDNTLEAHHVRFGSCAVVSLMMLTADFRQATLHQAFRKTTIQLNEDTSRTQDAAEPLSSETAPQPSSSATAPQTTSSSSTAASGKCEFSLQQQKDAAQLK